MSGGSRIVLPPSEVARQRAALAVFVARSARQAALEAGLSVSRAERSIRFTKPELARLLYLNARYGSAAFDTKTGAFQDRA